MTLPAPLRIALAAALAAPAAGCSVLAARLVADAEARAGTGASAAARLPVAVDVLEWANQARRQVGAPVLRPDPRLDAVAAEYSRELSARARVDHVSPTAGRETPDARMRAGGAAYAHWAENLAWTTSGADAAGGRVVQGWLVSPVHRGNLLDPRFRRVGTGVAEGADGTWFVVQLYAAHPLRGAPRAADPPPEAPRSR